MLCGTFVVKEQKPSGERKTSAFIFLTMPELLHQTNISKEADDVPLV